jgi:antibiotic biosynthesis monooxygenase (ABM) superfamily enzyme
MTLIDRDSGLTTVMVLMTVKPENQDALAELALAAESIFAKQPGFVSASLHRSADGTRLVQAL